MPSSDIQVSDALKQRALALAATQAEIYYANQVDFVLMGMDDPIPDALEAHINQRVEDSKDEEQDRDKIKAEIVRTILEQGQYQFTNDDATIKITKEQADIPTLGEDMDEKGEIISEDGVAVLICNGRAYAYKPGDILGKGENSTVYKAIDLVSGDLVVLKKQSSETAQLDGLKNEHAVALTYKVDGSAYGLGLAECSDNEGTSYFLIQKYIPGQTLDKYVTEDPLAMAKKVVAAVKDFQGQTEAMHRDLRPENIKVTESGAVVLLDPGAASKIEAGLARNPLGYTPGYTHPVLIAEIFNKVPDTVNVVIKPELKNNSEYLQQLIKQMEAQQPDMDFEGILQHPEYSEEYEAYALQKVIESIPGLKDIFKSKIATSFAQIDTILETAKLEYEPKPKQPASVKDLMAYWKSLGDKGTQKTKEPVKPVISTGNVTALRKKHEEFIEKAKPKDAKPPSRPRNSSH